MKTSRSQSIGLFSLVCLVVANMIGSSLYTSSGFALAALGHADRVLMVWIVAGLMAMCGAIAYGAIARRLLGSGGEYLYLSRLLHPSLGFLAGWISLVAGFTAPIAAAAEVFAVYAETPNLMRIGIDRNLVASAIILIATLLHSVRLQTGLWSQNLAVSVKLIGLATILVWGFFFVGPSTLEITPTRSLVVAENPIRQDSSDWKVAFEMLSSLVWISLAYTGFNAAIYVAGQAEDAKTRVPQAMLIATAIVTVIYIAMNYLFLYRCEVNLISGQPRIADIAAMEIGGIWMSRLMRITILLSSWTSVLSLLLTGPQVYAKMADDQVLPSFFKLSSDVPRLAVVVQAILAIVVVYLTNLKDLIGYLGLTLTACGALTVASMWRIRRYDPESLPLKWYEHMAAVLFIAMTIGMLMAASTFQQAQFYTMVATIVVGLLGYVVSEKFPRLAYYSRARNRE